MPLLLSLRDGVLPGLVEALVRLKFEQVLIAHAFVRECSGDWAQPFDRHSILLWWLARRRYSGLKLLARAAVRVVEPEPRRLGPRRPYDLSPRRARVRVRPLLGRPARVLPFEVPRPGRGSPWHSS